ncbi:hypothetical protein [Streptomyces atratus]|uniref:hypothetical protein n=1 Tax=Streptomyces atratus TaxID=1893 RepID=UPI00364CEE56
MQMLRCTRDTIVLHPDDHHQGQKQHPANHGRHPRYPSSSSPLHTTANSTTRSSGIPSPQALTPHLAHLGKRAVCHMEQPGPVSYRTVPWCDLCQWVLIDCRRRPID